MANLNSVVDNIASDIKDAARYAESAIDDGIDKVINLVMDLDEDIWDRYNDDDEEANRIIADMAEDIVEIRSRAIDNAVQHFSDAGFSVYDSDIEAEFNDCLDTVEWDYNANGLTDAVRDAS